MPLEEKIAGSLKGEQVSLENNGCGASLPGVRQDTIHQVYNSELKSVHGFGRVRQKRQILQHLRPLCIQ